MKNIFATPAIILSILSITSGAVAVAGSCPKQVYASCGPTYKPLKVTCTLENIGTKCGENIPVEGGCLSPGHADIGCEYDNVKMDCVGAKCAVNVVYETYCGNYNGVPKYEVNPVSGQSQVHAECN